MQITLTPHETKIWNDCDAEVNDLRAKLDGAQLSQSLSMAAIGMRLFATSGLKIGQQVKTAAGRPYILDYTIGADRSLKLIVSKSNQRQTRYKIDISEVME